VVRNWVTQNIPGVIEYLSGNPKAPGFRSDHGGSNYHDHLAFESEALARRAKAILEAQGVKVTEFGVKSGHAANSYHYSNQAFDVPGHQWGKATDPEVFEGSSLVRRLLLKGLGGGTTTDDGGTLASVAPAEQKVETVERQVTADWRPDAASGVGDPGDPAYRQRQDIAIWAQANPKLAEALATREGFSMADFAAPRTSTVTETVVVPEDRGALGGTTVGGAPPEADPYKRRGAR
jgi:hypothetical protein